MPNIRVSFSVVLLLIWQATVLPGAVAQDVSPPLYKMSTIIGQSVESKSGEPIGRIEDVVLKATTGDLVYAVLAADGFLGIGEKLFAIPWHAVRQTTEGKPFRLDMSAEQLKKAPSFDRHQWPDLEDRHWGDTIHAYYGQPPYWGKHLPAKTARENIRPIEPTQRLLRASFVMKRGVINTQGEWLGDIEDMVIDSAAAHVIYAVLLVGKGLDLGDRLFAVSWHALQQSAGFGTFKLDVDKRALQEASGFDQDHWPQQANPRWGG